MPMAAFKAMTASGELSLAGKGIDHIPDKAAERLGARLTSLDLSDNVMRDFRSFRHFHRLTDLVLDRNGLTVAALGGCPPLRSVDTLWLNNNEIDKLEEAMDVFCRCFPSLTYLSMLKNPAVPNMYFSDGEAEAYRNYRLYVIHRMPALEFLDATPVEDEELEEAKRVGHLMRVARPAGSGSGSGGARSRPAPGGRPAGRPARGMSEEAAAAPMAEPAAFLAKGRMRYDGTHSEGNRFIVNDDL